MSSFKGKKDSSSKELDFNKEEDFSSFIKNVAKAKTESGPKTTVTSIINLVTSNPKKTAILGLYFIICGVSINVKWIYFSIKFLINQF